METDQLTFEALRHRVATIADEGSTVLKMVSSSPVATEANDCNVAIMNAEGEAVAIGPGLSSHAIDCMMTTQVVLNEYAENPGFGPGDMFISNDPYKCSAHQTCVALVTPLYWEERIVAWVGSGIHLPDMGGPVPGQVAIGATSIYQEATPMPPLRIIEGGLIRKDIEAELTVRSRTSQQVALDFRALIAACERISNRLEEMIRRYTAGAIETLFEDMIEFNRAHLATRLRTIPDGEWEASVWLDFPQGGTTEFYECRLILKKREDRLGVDLSQSSSQSGAVINAGEPGLIAGILNALIVLLGYGLPRCPEAILRSVDIQSRPGTFVHAVPPAGCSKATTSACHAILMAFNLAMSKMYADTPGGEDRVLAGSGGFLPVIDVAGIDQHGERFGVPLLDMTLSSGFGAMLGKDGIDSAGPLHSPMASISNVETHEARYPMLYLWRRQDIDSGGLGQFRGGRGISLAWTPYGGGGDLDAIMHGHGCSSVSTPGVEGGYPGATNTFAVARETSCLEMIAKGTWPGDEDDLASPPVPTTGLEMIRLSEGDVVIARNSGGGGFGDPLDRDQAAVALDVDMGAVSMEWASIGYGVVFDGERVDEEKTEELRASMRERRLQDDELVEVIRDHSCRHCQGSELKTTRRRIGDLGRRILPHESSECFYAIETLCMSCGNISEIELVAEPGDLCGPAYVFVS